MINGQPCNIHDWTTEHVAGHEIPSMFSGLSQARESLVSHWHVASYSANNKWDSASENLSLAPQAGLWPEEKAASILARWHSAYDAYLGVRGDNLTHQKRKGTAVLSILKELGSTVGMLSQTQIIDERQWDIYYPMFDKIVNLANDIIELDLTSTSPTPVHCIDMYLVKPLFKVRVTIDCCFWFDSDGEHPS